MDVRLVIALTLTGCTSGTCEKLLEEDFVLDAELTADWVDAAGGDCEVACELAYENGSLQVTRVDVCELDTGDTGDTGGGAHVYCEGHAAQSCDGGRRPLGHVETRARGRTALGRRLATMASLEAASVTAFLELATQVACPTLAARCRAAAEDERRHARMVGALARRHGGRVPRPRRTASAADPVTHNAVEGCVHEAWAAMECHLLARHPVVGRLFAALAEDETRHAQLAWDLHAWWLARVDPARATAARRAQRHALAALAARGPIPAAFAGRLAAQAL
jgi:hypothetical protein